MLIGLLTDIHNHAAELAKALEVLCDRDVAEVITLGDTCDAFAPASGATDVTKMLAQCGAIGVWGNHDCGLCRDVADDIRSRFTDQTIEWMGQMQPSLQIDDCYFSHRAADVDPYDILALWSGAEDGIDLQRSALAAFKVVPQSRHFVGHYHRWAVVTPAGLSEWRGDAPIQLDADQKYFVVIDALFNGSCAVFDTVTGWLEPLHF